MTKTKDELIERWWQEYIDENPAVEGHLVSDEVEQLEHMAFRKAANAMYDHRQKEIDEAYERGLAAYVDRNLDRDKAIADEANRWWASKWREYRLSLHNKWLKEAKEFSAELDAAAARVMEVKG